MRRVGFTVALMVGLPLAATTAAGEPGVDRPEATKTSTFSTSETKHMCVADIRRPGGRRAI
jgi:hypothetical protein